VSLQTAPRGVLQARARAYGDHRRLVGPLPDIDSARLIAMVGDSGLTGRGGAGFPTARKLAAVSRRPGGVVVGNGAEGEPASSKDRVLLSEAPHLVLDGLQIAARAIRATSMYLYAPDDILRTTIRPALRERGARPVVHLVASPDTFVSGQETAVVAAIENQPALPTMPRVPVYERGVQRRPTLVSNVETLCQLALIARLGPDWFRSCGSEDEPGARLVTVTGAVSRPAVYEIPGGSRLGDIVDWAGGSSEPLQAILVGGYHGAWLPWETRTGELALSRSALRQYNAAPGAGVLIALPLRRCGLQATAAIMSYLAGESAGQCGPCLNGLPALARHAHEVAFLARTRTSLRELQRLAGLADGRGACHHPGGTVRMLRSALVTFAAETDLHLAGRCSGRLSDRSRR
jgi:NADH:ubiquinone oxidoreductase subunit F (NADH-binding)